MICMICGAKDQVVEVHGHLQCICGRILDGDCCQGVQKNESCVKTEGTERGEGSVQDSSRETGG